MVQRNRSWWELTRTPQQGFVLGALNSALALLAWMRVRLDDPSVWDVSAAIVFTVLTVAYVAAGVALRRRQEQLRAQVGEPSDR